MAIERRIFPYSGQADYAQTMRVLGPIQSETSDQVLSIIDRESLTLLHVRYLAGC